MMTCLQTLLINIRNIVFVVRYQRNYINNCCYNKFHEEFQVPATVY